MPSCSNCPCCAAVSSCARSVSSVATSVAIFASAKKSISSSGKSIAASTCMRSRVSCSVSMCTRCEKTPASERNAARAAVCEPASMRSATASACARSSLPFRNALGEIRPRAARAAERQQAREQHVEHHRTAVALKLEHVFAGVGLRRGKVQREACVNGFAIGIVKLRERGQPRPRQLAEHGLRQDGHGGPETRTTPIPPRPGAVAMAAMVCEPLPGARPRRVCGSGQPVAVQFCSRQNCRSASRYLAAAPMLRLICHCWAMERTLFTTQ